MILPQFFTILAPLEKYEEGLCDLEPGLGHAAALACLDLPVAARVG
jgi:hypothetical protein